MRYCSQGGGSFYRFMLAVCSLVGLEIVGCDSMSPSERLNTAIQLPVPTAVASAPSAERLSRERANETYVLSARSLIPIAFNLQPDIKASFQRFKSEEARYDFFVVSRDSLTPTFRSSNRVAESRDNPAVLRQRDNRVEIGVEKLFFDTTELNVGVGYQADVDDNENGSFPFVSADLRYPLWASREKLGRTSEEIFRRNELNDAQLDYIQEVRERLQSAMFRFYTVTDLDRRIGYASRYLEDLKILKTQIANTVGRDVTSDERRVQAEIAKLNAELRNVTGRRQVDVARLKAACGIPLYANAEIVVEPFNPFEGNTHEESFRLSIETDPEIRTLRNEIRNAEVQLDLARRGQWDIAILAAGESSIEGRNASDGNSDWALSIGFEVSHVDPRVTDSLTRQAQARIRRFTEAIAARENRIFVDTLEPLIRIDTLGQSRDELAENLPRFEEDYRVGQQEYTAGKLNIDDLLKRRESLWQQEVEISRLTLIVGFNVAELCTATGKFFELLEDDR